MHIASLIANDKHTFTDLHLYNNWILLFVSLFIYYCCVVVLIIYFQVQLSKKQNPFLGGIHIITAQNSFDLFMIACVLFIWVHCCSMYIVRVANCFRLSSLTLANPRLFYPSFFLSFSWLKEQILFFFIRLNTFQLKSIRFIYRRILCGWYLYSSMHFVWYESLGSVYFPHST